MMTTVRSNANYYTGSSEYDMMQNDFCLLPVMIIGYALIFAAMEAS